MNKFPSFFRKVRTSLGEYDQVYGALIIILIIFIYVAYKENIVEQNGICVVCKVIRYEPASDGSSTYCRVFIEGKEHLMISGMGNGNMVGKHYFGKVLREEPGFHFILYPDVEVPPYIYMDSNFVKGRITIPNCQ